MERRGREKEVWKAQALIPRFSLGAGRFRSLAMVPGVRGRGAVGYPHLQPSPRAHLGTCLWLTFSSQPRAPSSVPTMRSSRA